LFESNLKQSILKEQSHTRLICLVQLNSQLFWICMTPAGKFQYLLLLGDYKYAQVKHCAAQFYVSHSISSRVSQNKLKIIYKHLVLQYLTIISISHIRPPCHKLCIALQFQNSLLARNSFVQKVDFLYSSVLGQKTKIYAPREFEKSVLSLELYTDLSRQTFDKVTN
jgi:hypothetical protein